jgi:hypothetical protein
MLSEVEKILEKLNEHKKDPSKQYEFGQGYYDDLSLVRLLEGVCQTRYPEARRFNRCILCLRETKCLLLYCISGEFHYL